MPPLVKNDEVTQHKSAALLEYESNWAAAKLSAGVPKQYHQYRSGATGHTYAAETRIEEQPVLDYQKNGTDAKYSWRPPVSAAAEVTPNASPECPECATSTPECNQDILNHPDEGAVYVVRLWPPLMNAAEYNVNEKFFIKLQNINIYIYYNSHRFSLEHATIACT